MISPGRFAKALELRTIVPASGRGMQISVADLCRPGLQFAGYFDFFANERPQVIGWTEMHYLLSLPADVQRERLNRYFSHEMDTELVDGIAESLMRTVMRQAKILLKDPTNYNARAEVMWAGSLSHNGLTSSGLGQGDWATHNMEHEMGGLFDVAHGAGMAAIWGSWARYVHHAAPHRFVRFAVNVMGVEKDADDEVTIERGIQAVENWYRSIDMPTNMRELGIAPTEEQILWMAQSAEIKTGGGNGSVVNLKKEDMAKIYTMAL